MTDQTNTETEATGTAAAPAPAIAQPALAVRAAWETAVPSRRDYDDVVAELSSLKFVGERIIFERGPYVFVTHMGYFKPPPDAFVSELMSRDRRPANEWEYINAVGVWTELGLTALGVAKDQNDTVPGIAQKLALAEKSIKAAFEVLSMRAQFFWESTEQGVEAARQMSFLVKQGHDAVFPEPYRTAREFLTTKLETEAAKMLAKARLERATGSKGVGSSNTGPIVISLVRAATHGAGL